MVSGLDAGVNGCMKTNFTFEVQIPESSTGSGRDSTVMQSLEPSLKARLAEHDGAATVVVSDNHRSANSKIAELTTTLGDAEIAAILKKFCAEQGVTVKAME
jgi:hypothetical protein